MMLPLNTDLSNTSGNEAIKRYIIEFSLLTLSAAMTALAVRLFFSEYDLTPGGITGLAITMSSVTGVPIDVISLCISVPLLIAGTLILGSKFGGKTLYITLITPVFLRVIPQTHVAGNALGAAILGGLLVGGSVGIALRCSCATGGTDVIALLLHRILPRIDVSVLLFIVDMSIVCSSWYISGNQITSIYSAASLAVIMVTIRFVTSIKGHE